MRGARRRRVYQVTCLAGLQKKKKKRKVRDVSSRVTVHGMDEWKDVDYVIAGKYHQERIRLSYLPGGGNDGKVWGLENCASV